MAGTGGRMLDLLSLLQARHHWRGDELARRLEVSDRTLRRDIDRLRGLGYPVHSTRGLDGGYQLGPGTRLPPLLLSNDEAVAVAIGLLNATGQPIGGIADAAVSALLKITQLLPPELRSETEAIAAAVGAPARRSGEVVLETLTILARSSRDRERLRFSYSTYDGSAGERHVEPHHVVPLGRRWYLVAWDLDRADWRTFRLDRVTEPRQTAQRFEARQLPADTAAEFVTRSLAAMPTTYHVELVVEAPLHTVTELLGPRATASTDGPHTTRIEMDVDDLPSAVMVLAALNANVRSAEPPELQSLLEQLAERFRIAT